jgi:hypothetical protein
MLGSAFKQAMTTYFQILDNWALRTIFRYCSTLQLILQKKNSVTLVRQRTIPTERPPMSAKLVPTLADRGCRVVCATNPHGLNFGFLDRSCYFSIQVAPQLYSWGWVDPVPDQLLLRKSSSAGNRTRDLWICSQKLWPLDHSNLTINYSTITMSFRVIIPLNEKWMDDYESGARKERRVAVVAYLKTTAPTCLMET